MSSHNDKAELGVLEGGDPQAGREQETHWREGEKEARVREDSARSRDDLQDHSFVREDKEPVLERVPVPQAPTRAGRPALRDGGEGLYRLGPPFEGELHPDREGGRTPDDVSKEGSLHQGEEVSSLKEDDGLVRGRQADLAQGVSLTLDSRDSEFDAQAFVHGDSEEEAREEEGDRTAGENRRLQHKAAHLPEVYERNQHRDPINPEIYHFDELDNSLKILSQSQANQQAE